MNLDYAIMASYNYNTFLRPVVMTPRPPAPSPQAPAPPSTAPPPIAQASRTVSSDLQRA